MHTAAQASQADTPTNTPTDSYTFAQISDPHLTRIDQARWRQLLNKRFLGYLSWRKRRRSEHRPEVLRAVVEDLRNSDASHLVITGDLTHIGLPEEFRQAAHWLKHLGPPGDVTVIPGNHEAYVQIPWEESYALWRDYLVSDAGSPTDADMFPTLRVRGPLAIIGVNSALATAPFLATGQVGLLQRRRLEQLLRETALRGLFRVVLIHHTPAPGVDKWRKRLTDRAQVGRVLEEQGAELVLHGHTHRPVWSELSGPVGPIPVISPPSGSALSHRRERNARYHLYRIRSADGGWTLEVEARGYSAQDGGMHSLETRCFALKRPC